MIFVLFLRREELRRIVLTDEILELPALVRKIAESVEELAAAQQRTEQRVDELAEAQRRTGVAVEEEVAGVVEVVLRRKGYCVLQPAFSLALDGEIDVVLLLEDPSGRQIWTVLEAKARLTGRDVHAWSQRMHEPSWHQRLAKKGCPGPYLVYAYGIRIDLSAQEAAQKEGIGLIKSDGEILAPLD